MRKIVNFFLTMLVMWGSSMIFTSNVKFDGWGSIILASLIMYAVGVLYVLLILPLLATYAVSEAAGCIFTILFFIGAILISFIKIWVADMILPGFSMSGFIPYIVTVIALSIFNISAPKQESNK